MAFNARHGAGGRGRLWPRIERPLKELREEVTLFGSPEEKVKQKKESGRKGREMEPDRVQNGHALGVLGAQAEAFVRAPEGIRNGHHA